MLHTSRWIIENLGEDIMTAHTKYPNYRIVLTGHSLGAGVATIAGLIWRSHPIFGAKIEVYAYASPCVVSREISELSSDFITSVCLGSDCITRLSVAALKQFYRRMDALKLYPKYIVKEAMVLIYNYFCVFYKFIFCVCVVCVCLCVCLHL